MDWKTKPEPIAETLIASTSEADVVVVGLGYAGSAAARAAAEAGASVIGLENMKKERQVLFGRDIGHINSAFLRSRGVPAVDPTDLFNEWMRRAGNRANPGLVMKFCKNSGDAFDWYTDMYSLEDLKDLHVAFWPGGGEKFRAATQAGDCDINGYHFWYGTAQFPDPIGWPGKPTLQDCAKANMQKAAEAGANLVYERSAEQLLTESGRVTGVIAKDREGVYHRYLAHKAVILAAGDFSGNREMVQDLCCDLPDIMTPEEKLMPNPGRKGRGIQMGMWAGGRLESRPLPTMGGNMIQLNGPGTFGSLWLNLEGNRFCNEVFGGTELRGFAGNQNVGGRGDIYCIFDEHYMENELQWAYPSHGNIDANTAGVMDQLTDLIRRGKAGEQEIEVPMTPPMRGNVTIYTGKTPEELVSAAGIEGDLAQSIVKSIHRYNEMCSQGRDEDFGRDSKLLDPLTDTLFLQKAKPSMMFQMLVSVGGLVTDDRQQVLDSHYCRIPGLFATGNCCGRRFGTQYSTPIAGVSIGIAITLGREAGKEAAAYTG